MSFLLRCPFCGERSVYEFRFGGEVKHRPVPGASDEEWYRYTYVKENAAGEQTEWWYHLRGCCQWLKALRNTVSNEVIRTWFADEETMPWVVKFDKEDFIGKAALERAASQAPRERLAGFVVDGEAIPEDGAAIVIAGRPAGRVTSVRYSPLRRKAVGLAWVPAEKVAEGAEIHIHAATGLCAARVTQQVFHDPEGARLRQ